MANPGPLERITANGQLIVLPFLRADLADADAAMVTPLAAVSTYVLPFDAWLVGVSFKASGVLTTGSLELNLDIAGNADVLELGDPVLNSTISEYTDTWGLNEAYRIPAGSTIGVSYDKTGTVDPTTVDLSVLLFLIVADLQQ